jgi:hypothetical protein
MLDELAGLWAGTPNGGALLSAVRMVGASGGVAVAPNLAADRGPISAAMARTLNPASRPSAMLIRSFSDKNRFDVAVAPGSTMGGYTSARPARLVIVRP